MSSMIKFVAGITGGIFAFFFVRYAMFEETSSAKSRTFFPLLRSEAPATPGSLDTDLVQACNEINKHCPMNVDAYTRLDNASTADKRIIYYYTLLDMPDDLVRKNQSELKKIVSNTARTNQDTSKLLQDGIEMEYVYKNKEGKELVRFSVK